MAGIFNSAIFNSLVFNTGSTPPPVVVEDTHDAAERTRKRDARKRHDKEELRRQLESFFNEAPPEYLPQIAQEAKGYVDEQTVDWEPLLADMATVSRLLDLRDDWMDEEDFIILH